jgi:hypothetical protein
VLGSSLVTDNLHTLFFERASWFQIIIRARSGFPIPTRRESWCHASVVRSAERWSHGAGTIGATPDDQLLLHVPAQLDWFSVDIYPDQFTPAGMAAWYHSFIRTKMTANQSFVLVPPFCKAGAATPIYYFFRAAIALHLPAILLCFLDGDSGSETLGDVVADCDDTDCDAAMARWADFCVRWVQSREVAGSRPRIVAASKMAQPATPPRLDLQEEPFLRGFLWWQCHTTGLRWARDRGHSEARSYPKPGRNGRRSGGRWLRKSGSVGRAVAQHCRDLFHGFAESERQQRQRGAHVGG